MSRIVLVLAVAVLAACDDAGGDPDSATDASSAVPLGPVATLGEANGAKAESPAPGGEAANVVVHVASGSNVSATDAAAIASVMRSGLSRCVLPGRKAAVAAELTVEAEPSGKIRSAGLSSETELPADFEACLERRTRVAYFPATEAGAKVKLRVRFEPR